MEIVEIVSNIALFQNRSDTELRDETQTFWAVTVDLSEYMFQIFPFDLVIASTNLAGETVYLTADESPAQYELVWRYFNR